MKIIAQPFAISCRLNKYFDSLKRTEKYKGDDASGWSDYFIEKETGNRVGSLYGSENNCCGIEELHFASIGRYHNSIKNQKDFDELAANYIWTFIRRRDDHRILIAGLVISPRTNWLENYYSRLKDCLKRFGFVQLHNKAYLNKNSGNRLVVMAGQL